MRLRYILKFLFYQIGYEKKVTCANCGNIGGRIKKIKEFLSSQSQVGWIELSEISSHS